MIACDLGSNTLRVVQIDPITKTRVKEYEKAVKTAQGLHKTGIICDEAINRILEALSEASKIFDFKNIEVHCVTTEAMRLATNSQKVIDTIKENFDLDFKIIDGDEEARLTLLGVENGMKLYDIDNTSYCMLDLGGGSTEISFTCKGITTSKSFNFGIVLIAEKHVSLENIKNNIAQEVSVIDDFIKDKKAEKFIATAGTPTTVCAFLQGIDYHSYDHKKINGKSLHVDDFSKALNKLLVLNEVQREFWVGTNKADLICAGILIVQEIMKKLGFYECIVIDDGLREGLAISKSTINVISI